MSDIPIAEPIPGAPAAFTTDLPCVICGYNLRGLMPGGRCPECGSPVDRSVHGNLLRYADRAWLEKLLLGIRLMLWSILTAVVIGLGAGVTEAVGGPPILQILAQSALSGLDLAAAILLTTPEPRIVLSEDTVALRKAIRLCAVAACVGQVLQAIDELTASVTWLSVVALILLLAATVSYFGKLVYLRRFALRIPDARLARSTRTVMWGIVISAGIALVLGVVGAIVMALNAAVSGGAAAGTPGPAASIPVIGFACIVGVCALVFGIWYLILLFDYRNAFRKAIDEVRSFELQTARG